MDDPKISPDKPAIDEATANKVVSDHKNPPAGTLALAGFRAAFAALLMVIALSAAFPYMAENLAPGTIFTPIMILIMFITLAHMAWDASSLLRKPAGMSSRAMAKLIAACILPSIPIFMFIRSHDMSFFFFIAAMAFVVMCALIIFGGETINIENFLKGSAAKRPEKLPLSPGAPMIMVILRNVTLRVFLAMLLSIGFSFFFFVILKANVELT
ncbi:MAG: hypothetical protein LBT23_01265, partial [Synergistaceae bacterium]|nr:hypothetical protein [Synergistaceae bacterium]